MLTDVLMRTPCAAPTCAKLIACVPDCEMKPDGPAFARRLLAGLAHAEPGLVEAHAVRADERQAGLARDAADLGLETRAFFFAGLGEAGREQRHAADRLRCAVGDDARRDVARHGAHHVVDLVRDVLERREVRHAQLFDAGDLVRIDLHGVDLALERAHVAQPEVAVGALVADDGDGARAERARSLSARLHCR